MTLKAQSRTEQLQARIAELESALAREERISSALREVGVALGTTLDLDQLLELILQKITDLLQADRATLYLLDETRGELVSRIAVGDAIRSVRMRVGEGIAGMVARTGRTIRVRDAYRDKRFTRASDELPGYRTQSILAAPMKNHLGRIIGVVHVLNKKSRRDFTAGDEALLNAFATEAAVSIDNSRLFLSVVQKNMQLLETKEKLEQSVRHLKLLFELESTMGRAGSQEELIRGVLFESAEACDASGGAILLTGEHDSGFELALWDAARPSELGSETWRGLPGTSIFPEGASLRPGTSLPPESASMRPGTSLPPTSASMRPGTSLSPEGAPIRNFLTRALQQRQPLRIGPDQEGGAEVVQGALRLQSALAVPLEWEDGSPMGALALFNKSDGRSFAAEDAELLRIIGANFCTAINLFRARVKRVREERLSTIGSLLSSVVHDLKGPMAVISGYVQMMSDVEDATKRKEYAGLILKQFESIAAMQREVLEFARGEKRLFARKVYLAKYFEDLITELRADLGNPKVELVLDLSDRTTARFDQNKITRVVHNLVRNAIEAIGTKRGRVTVRVSRDLPPDASKKGDLIIEVSDTGPGVPKQIEARLFESFVTAGKKGGTGLGLAIVKKIAIEHGGTVDVQSTPSGTTFTLVLPQDDSKT